jgi:hypothetical protein
MSCKKGGRKWTRRVAAFAAVFVLAGTCAVSMTAQDNNRVAEGEAAAVGQRVPGPAGGPDLPKAGDMGPRVVPDPIQARMQREQRKLRFEKMKQQAGELADMVRSLREELEKSGPDVLAVGVTEKAKKIQKLAGKIRNESRF